MSPPQPRPLDRWLAEVGPLVAVTGCLWAKLVYVTIQLPRISWAGGEAVPILSIIRAYPDVFSATLACLLLLVALLPLARRTWRFVSLLVLDLFLTTLAVGDLIHVRLYADVTSSSELGTAPMLASVVESVFALLEPTDAIYYLDIVLAALALPIYVRLARQVPALRRGPLARLCAALAIAGVLMLLPTIRLASSEPDGVFAYTTLRLETASAIGILPYHLSETLASIGYGERSIGQPERERVRRFIEEEGRQRGGPSDLFGIAAGKNVIVISAESIQAFPIGLVVAGQAITPRLSELARESMHFVNYYEPTHLGSTSDAEFAVMQSLYPLPVGVVAAKFARNHYRGLPAILAERGYSTLSAVGAQAHFWNMNQLHPRYGFQRSFYEDSYRLTELILVWLSDREFFRQTLPILRAQSEPFMAFLLSSSSHHPYYIPERLRSLHLGDLEGTTVGNYLHAVHYFDQALGEFVDHLRETGLLEQSVLVVYGDHQGFVHESAELPRLLGFEGWTEYQHFKVIKKVPLFIRLPHGEAAGVKTVTGSHLDVAPTVLSLLGIRDPSAVMLGKDLTLAEDSLVVFRDGSFADGRHYFANRFGQIAASRCYEAETGQTVDCGPLEARRREARERLEVSDLIIHGDLIRALTTAREESPSR